MARSVAPSSRAPASDVIAPPVNEATTERPSTGAKRRCLELHCVGIGELLWPEPSRCGTTTLTQSEPRCTFACEIYGLAARPQQSDEGGASGPGFGTIRTISR